MIWEKNPGEFHSVHGFCSPPMLYKDLVIVNGDQDAPTGRRVHRRARQEDRRGEVAHRPAEQAAVVLPAGRRSTRPGKKQTGADRQQVRRRATTRTPASRYWIIDGPTEQFVSSMVLHDGVLLMTAGFPGQLGHGDRPERQRQRDEDARALVEEERGRLRALAGRARRQAVTSWTTTASRVAGT